jgi:hypothetical protein
MRDAEIHMGHTAGPTGRSNKVGKIDTVERGDNEISYESEYIRRKGGQEASEATRKGRGNDGEGAS